MRQVSRESLQTYLVNKSWGRTSSCWTDTQHQEAKLQSRALHVAAMTANQSTPTREKQEQPLPPAQKRAKGTGWRIYLSASWPLHMWTAVTFKQGFGDSVCSGVWYKYDITRHDIWKHGPNNQCNKKDPSQWRQKSSAEHSGSARDRLSSGYTQRD